MHHTTNYANRPAPAFDAIEDIKEYLGPERWAAVSPEMAKLTNCGAFALYASLGGISGFPVIAWYELYHGQGSWKQHEVEALS